MAPESIEKLIFNEMSDVWSFGVFMWEIFSEQIFPYANILNENLLRALKDGDRLPKPDNTTPELYAYLHSISSTIRFTIFLILVSI